MADFIAVSDSYWLTGQLLSNLRRLATEIDALQRLKESMEEMIDGGDYTVVEQQFGLQTGEGTLLYNLLTGALVDLQGTNVQQLIARVLQ